MARALSAFTRVFNALWRAPGEGQPLATNSKPSALQLREDHRENAFFIRQHVGIPESQHVITVRAERGIARAVPRSIRVLPTVNLDDEFFYRDKRNLRHRARWRPAERI